MIHWLVLFSVFLADVNAQAGCPPIVSHTEWAGRNYPCRDKLRNPVELVVIHHTTGNPCNDRNSCITQMKSHLDYHVNTNKLCDIAYHFVIGGDGAVYEGRGWRTIGAHAKGVSTKNIGIAFIGTFTNGSPTNAALNAAQKLIRCGVDNKFIRADYTLKGHRNVFNTACPGDSLYKTIQSWPRFRA